MAAVSTVSGQTFGPMTGGAMPGGAMPGPMQGDPYAGGSVYSPAGPQAAFGPNQPGFGPGWGGPDMQLPQANGMMQPGEMQNLNFSQPLGDYGNVQLYGAPTGQHGVGGSFQANPATWAHVRDLQMGVYTNDEQTVINGGSTFEFFVNDRYGLGGRVLLGGAINEEFGDDFHFTGDLYGGTTRFGDHWIKGGVLYDLQNNFHKVGPAFAALLFAEHKHPISLDFAYGFGYGTPKIDRGNSTILTIADDDVQFRAGTYLTPNLQAGFSGLWTNFDDKRFTDYNGYGGFVNLNLGTLGINVDVTHGDYTRGFVNVSYTFGGRRARGPKDCGPLLVEHPRDWLGKPIMRDVSLQLQQVRVDDLPPARVPPGQPPTQPPATPLVGNLTQVNFRLGPGSGGLDGIVDPGDGFTLNIQLVNGSGQTANQIFAGTVTSSSNLGIVTGGANVVDVGTLLPGQQTNITLPSLGAVTVPVIAQIGDQFFIDFDVTSDGQNRRFRVPITVGVTNTGTGFAPAIPL